MANSKIIEYVGSLVTYPIPKPTVERIIKERGLDTVTDWADISLRDKNLVLADLLLAMFTAPSNTGSRSRSHGDFSITIGGVVLTDKNDIYSLMMQLYKNPDKQLWEILDSIGGCSWME